ncbi:hypothetical protein BDD12DRAFT_664831, partial [Trichophaea hybrida]
SNILHQAKEYIVTHTQGVLLWVQLVKKELQSYAETGYSEVEIFEALTALPTELGDFYAIILGRLSNGMKRDIRDGEQMFELILFAPRPVKVAELNHIMAI